MYGIKVKIFNNATDEWEWRWARTPVTREVVSFATQDAASVYAAYKFPGRSAADVKIERMGDGQLRKV